MYVSCSSELLGDQIPNADTPTSCTWVTNEGDQPQPRVTVSRGRCRHSLYSVLKLLQQEIFLWDCAQQGEIIRIWYPQQASRTAGLVFQRRLTRCILRIAQAMLSQNAREEPFKSPFCAFWPFKLCITKAAAQRTQPIRADKQEQMEEDSMSRKCSILSAWWKHSTEPQHPSAPTQLGSCQPDGAAPPHQLTRVQLLALLQTDC